MAHKELILDIAGGRRVDSIRFDDQEKNFGEAKRIGWNALLADGNGNWISEITAQLSTGDSV